MPSRLFAFTIMIHALVSAPVASGQSSSTPLLVAEQDGRVKERLRSAVQMGLPLRIGMSIDWYLRCGVGEQGHR
jgi:hypothetical protein